MKKMKYINNDFFLLLRNKDGMLSKREVLESQGVFVASQVGELYFWKKKCPTIKFFRKRLNWTQLFLPLFNVAGDWLWRRSSLSPRRTLTFLFSSFWPYIFSHPLFNLFRHIYKKTFKIASSIFCYILNHLKINICIRSCFMNIRI